MGLVPEIEKASCLLSINGISNGVLYNFLSEHPEVLTIYACLQNDSAGLKATQNISQRVMVKMQPILRDYSLKNSYVKTWNAIRNTGLKNIKRYKKRSRLIKNSAKSIDFI